LIERKTLRSGHRGVRGGRCANWVGEKYGQKGAREQTGCWTTDAPLRALDFPGMTDLYRSLFISQVSLTWPTGEHRSADRPPAGVTSISSTDASASIRAQGLDGIEARRAKRRD